jgi:ABC-2 type transport system ATP-binding protein
VTVRIWLFIAAAILAILLNIIGNFKTKSSKRFDVTAKVFSLIFLACYLVRLFQEDKIDDVLGFNNSIFAANVYYVLVILRAVTMMCVLVLVTAPWFKRRTLLNLAAFVVPVVYFLNIYYYNINIYAFLDYIDIPSYSLREIQFAIECVLGLALGTMYLVRKFLSRTWRPFFKQLFLMIINGLVLSVLIMPYGTLGNLFGDIGEVVGDFNKTHIGIFVVCFATIIVAYITLRNRPFKDKHYVLTMFVYIMFVQFFYYYSWPFTPSTMPLHLCHAAVILMVITFTFKSKRLFYFGFFVNTIGAFFAMLTPTVDKSLFTSLGVHFWFEHASIFTVPIVAVVIGLFPRPNMKAIIWCMITFTCYYAIVTLLNAYWWNEGANYFFMNETKLVDVAKDVVPERIFGDVGRFFANVREDVTYVDIHGHTFRFYKTFWIGIYIVYTVFILAEWLFYFGMFRVADDHHNLHLIKKEKGLGWMNIRRMKNKMSKTEPLYPEDKDVIRISNFTKIYSGSKVRSVDDFSLTIRGGDVYGFLGHNGAGKSTTIKSIVGIQTITEGTISVCGFDIEKQPVAAKLNIGYVSDNHAVYEKLTGREYINYVANLYLVPEEERKERFEKYVKMFNLQDAIDREIKGYSHGMKQKIVVIASLMHDPKVWILDEPLTGLDPTSSFQIKECMRDHANRGNIVFFSSHVIEVVEKICDKICIIGHGKLIGEWEIKKLGEEGMSLEQLYMKYVATQNLVTDVDGKRIEDEIQTETTVSEEEISKPVPLVEEKEAVSEPVVEEEKETVSEPVVEEEKETVSEPVVEEEQEPVQETEVITEEVKVKKKRYSARSGPKKAPKKRVKKGS